MTNAEIKLANSIYSQNPNMTPKEAFARARCFMVEQENRKSEDFKNSFLYQIFNPFIFQG